MGYLASISPNEREGIMRLKQMASAAAIAASAGMLGLSTGVVSAHADPPAPCNQPNCQGFGGPPRGPSGPQQHDFNGPPSQDGPRNIQDNRRAPGQGGPPPPSHGQPGWNDGPPPGGPPRGWDGPTPPGGWDGAPPPGGWNRHWDGPPRDIDQGRFDHQPFDYDDYQAVPIWSPDMGGWGFWFFGTWIPL
jgi:hypothetical protein